MSKLLISLFVATALLSTTGLVEWHSPTTHDFGDILRGQPVEQAFYFTNRSSEPILIQNVRTSCGCTTSEWPERPIAPDSTGQLTITYDAAKSGYFYKSVKVYFSGQKQAERLYLEGFVENE